MATDPAGNFERDIADGLTAIERAVLAMWDAGENVSTIAARLERGEKQVAAIVKLYDDRPGPDPRAGLAAANAQYVSAIRLQQERGQQAKRPPLLSVDDIEAMLEDRIEQLVNDLLPNARREGHEMCVGSVAGEPGQSLRIHVGGAKRGWWKDYCHGGTGRDGGNALWLIAETVCGSDVKRAVAWAKHWLGIDERDPGRVEQHRIEATARAEERARAAATERQRNIDAAQRRWHQGQPLASDNLVWRYFAGRAIDLALLPRPSGALRFHPALQYGATPHGQSPLLLPAMVAMVTNLAGEHVATHRTYLDPRRPAKAGPDLIGYDHRGRPKDAKKVMGSPLGGHISVWKGRHAHPLKDVPAGTDVYVAEGIEDGTTVAIADPGLRVIALPNGLNTLIDLELPAQMGRLVLLKQNDPPGSDADRLMTRAVAHHRAANRKVMFCEPPAGVKDLNDLAQRGVE